MAGFIVLSALFGGAVIYYLQVYAYYEPVVVDGPDATQIRLTSLVSDTPEPILVEGLEGIDADSSPLRFRACFTTAHSVAMLSETYVTFDDAVPLVAPGWFECFDAVQIGEALEVGEAFAFLSERNIQDGVDRVVAIFPDGRGFAWHQLNEKFAK